MFQFKVVSNVVVFKDFLKDVKEITNENLYFLYRPAKRCTKTKKILFKKENLVEFLEDVLYNCHSLRDKRFLYFLFSYLLFRFKRYPNESLKFILCIPPVENKTELKEFISSNLSIRFKESILKDYDSLYDRLNLITLNSLLEKDNLVEIIQDHLKKTRVLLEMVEKIYS